MKSANFPNFCVARLIFCISFVNDYVVMTILFQCFNDYVGYTKVCTTKYPSNIGHDLILPNSVELAMFTFPLGGSDCLTSISGNSFLSENCDYKRDINDAKNIDCKHDDDDILKASDRVQSHDENKKLSLPPHWRAHQPTREEKSNFDYNIDNSHDVNNNNRNESNQSIDNCQPYESNNTDFEENNIDNTHLIQSESDMTKNVSRNDIENIKNPAEKKNRKYQFVISENLTDEYHQPELD